MRTRSTADERARECGCPPWVEECTHKGRLVVALASPQSLRAEAKVRKIFLPKGWRFRWSVYGPACWAKGGPDAPNATGMTLPRTGPGTTAFGGDEKRCRAEFDRRAVQLVGGTA